MNSKLIQKKQQQQKQNKARLPTPQKSKKRNVWRETLMINLNGHRYSLCLENKFIIQSRSYHVIWISILYFPSCSYMLDENFLYFSICNDRSFHNTTNTKCTHWP